MKSWMIAILIIIPLLGLLLPRRNQSNKTPPAENEVETVMSRIHDAIGGTNETERLVSLQKLPKAARVAWATWIVQCEVENGGFAQYFWNMESEGYYAEALAGFDEMGATRQREIFATAWDLIKPQLPIMHTMQGPSDRFARYKPLLVKEGLATKLGELDSAFYHASPSLEEIRAKYLAAHKPELRSLAKNN